MELIQERADVRAFNPLTNPTTAAFMGLLQDEAKDVILTHVRSEQDRRIAIAEACKRVLDLCPTSDCGEYVCLLASINDLLYPAGVCGPMSPERKAYDALMKPLATDEWAGSIEANLDALMNGPLLQLLKLRDREAEAEARIQAHKAARAS